MVVREGLRTLLEGVGYRICSAVESYDELLDAVERDRPDVVVTDIRMPPTRTDEGVRAALTIRRCHPSIGVVVLSQYLEPGLAVELFAQGADGLAYLLKERVGDVDQLRHAIEEVAAGRSVIDTRVVETLVRVSTPKRSPLADLTERELEVLTEMATGKSNSAIADSLYLSERAIEKHIGSIFTKLGLLPEKETNRRVRAVLMYLSERN